MRDQVHFAVPGQPDPSKETFAAAVRQAIEAAKAAYGEPEFAYFKKCVQWRSPRRRGESGTHVYTIGDGAPITAEEYAANIAESKRLDTAQFMGEMKGRSYWRYERRLVREGWREHLLKAIPEYNTHGPARCPHTQEMPQ